MINVATLARAWDYVATRTVAACVSTWSTRPRRPSARRRAFTLVELLMVCSIITLVAATVMFALFGALQQAKEDRTRAQIAKLNEVVMAQFESYRTRRLSVTMPPNANPLQQAQIRLDAIRQLMRMEMPERITDIFNPGQDGNWGESGRDDDNDGVTDNITEAGWVNTDDLPTANPQFFAIPARALAYSRMVRDNQRLNGIGWSVSHQYAECLYMIVVNTVDEDGGSAIDFFAPSEIGDVDGDGMKEILDGWGNPIQFLRWPAGFTAQRGPDGAWGVAGQNDDGDAIIDNGSEAEWPGSDDQPSPSQLQTPDPRKSPDLFDPRKIDLRWKDSVPGNEPYALYPLIISAGKDEQYGIQFDVADNNNSGVFNYLFFTPGNFGVPDPYLQQQGQPFLIGTPTDEERVRLGGIRLFQHVDNISNHNMGVQ